MAEKPMTRHAAKTVRVLYDAFGRPETGQLIPIGSVCELLPPEQGLWPVSWCAANEERQAFLKELAGLIVYYNQGDWGHVAYPAAGFPSATVKTGGCGIASVSMVVEALTGQSFDPAACAALALQIGARIVGGTDLRLLGRAIASRFGLFYLTTSDLGALRQHLATGKPAIASVGGNRPGHKGLFSDGGHFLAILAEEGGLLTIADPANSPGKYGMRYPHRQSVVKRAGMLLRVLPTDLDADCMGRTPKYHLFG